MGTPVETRRPQATGDLTADLTAIVFALSFSTPAYIFNCLLPW